MIDFKLKYQASIFLDAQSINASPDNIGKMLLKFTDKGFVPNIFQEITPVNPKPQNRFRMQSPNGEWVTSIGSTRIDIEQNPTNLKGTNLKEAVEFGQEATDIIGRILDTFPKKSNRLAFVSSFMLKEMTQEELNSYYERLFNSPDLYKQNQPFEWNWRTASRLTKQINNKEETFNFITSINRVTGEINNPELISEFDRVEISFDINSVPMNNEHRFGMADIGDFLHSSPKWHDELLGSVLNFLK